MFDDYFSPILYKSNSLVRQVKEIVVTISLLPVLPSLLVIGFDQGVIPVTGLFYTTKEFVFTLFSDRLKNERVSKVLLDPRIERTMLR